MSKGARIFLVIFGVVLCVMGAVFFFVQVISGSSDKEEEVVEWFDPYTASEEKQMVEFEMISYPFANFELSSSQELYFVFDEYMSVYIVCMETERFENEFADIYEYTFNDVEEPPRLGTVEGYAVEIDDELKEIAIEEFNYLWGSDVFTEDNFVDYIGYYYLDTTYQPESSEDGFIMYIAAILCIGLGACIIYSGVKPNKKENEIKTAPTVNTEAAQGDGTDASQFAGAETVGSTYTNTEAGELPIQGNIIVALLASIICAAAGGVVWILVYSDRYGLNCPCKLYFLCVGNCRCHQCIESG